MLNSYSEEDGIIFNPILCHKGMYSTFSTLVTTFLFSLPASIFENDLELVIFFEFQLVFIAEDIRGCVMSTQDSLKYFIASRSIYRFLREKVTSKKFVEKENLISGVPWKTNLQSGHRVTWD